jgi:hypothetical protein
VTGVSASAFRDGFTTFKLARRLLADPGLQPRQPSAFLFGYCLEGSYLCILFSSQIFSRFRPVSSRAQWISERRSSPYLSSVSMLLSRPFKQKVKVLVRLRKLILEQFIDLGRLELFLGIGNLLGENVKIEPVKRNVRSSIERVFRLEVTGDEDERVKRFDD